MRVLMGGKELRQEKLARRDKLSTADIKVKSEKIVKTVVGLELYQQAKTILYYINFRSEVETRNLIEKAWLHGKTVLAPLTVKKDRLLKVYQLNSFADLRSGFQGIPEPDPAKCQELKPAEIDIVIVPGSVFDERGGRMGYGGGYYDRFLADFAPQARRLGVCYELQIIKLAPLQDHDEILDLIVTERRVIEGVR